MSPSPIYFAILALAQRLTFVVLIAALGYTDHGGYAVLLAIMWLLAPTPGERASERTRIINP